jgi:hypothetical protein
MMWWVKLVSMGGVDYRAKQHKPLHALIENDLHNYGNIKKRSNGGDVLRSNILYIQTSKLPHESFCSGCRYILYDHPTLSYWLEH